MANCYKHFFGKYERLFRKGFSRSRFIRDGMAIGHEYSDSIPWAVRSFPQANYKGQYDGGSGNARA